MEERKRLRRRMKQLRSAMAPEERERADRQIFFHLQELEAYRSARIILSYISIGAEADTRAVIRKALAEGRTVCCPVSDTLVRGEAGIMRFYRIENPDALRPGVFGIPEPEPDSAGELRPETLRSAERQELLMLMPGLAFDPDRNRIGFGGGYYDRYLREHGPLPTAALAYAGQIVPHIPVLPHDRRPDCIITENGVIGP
ncbi:5-formyltetrahydrofolate cyclo-ligase [Lachnoclostridium sp. Marseille-P6806]|uniref:5-formyltetrahydrofolate cyclo-ligase n=1 Tax=Lachnoclostridium sp. Marseille-P6806 TaxID=2364793 RepID=UPI0013EF1781|nr:5-formyltetrahydrofolate cyclo-ligase [Lachnoclostridium sp. Marseille-P6806]